MIDCAVIVAVSTLATPSQLTAQRPSAMLPALGKPMVVRVMDRLYRAGIRRFVVIVGINEGAVASYLNKQWMPDAKTEFVLKSNESLTAVFTRIAHQLNTPFIVAGYNSFTYERFISTLIRLHDENPDALVLTGARLTLSPKNANYYGVVRQGQITQISQSRSTTEKESYVLAEHGIVGHKFLEFLKSIDAKHSFSYGKDFMELATHYGAVPDNKVVLAETSWILSVEEDADLLLLNKRMLDDSNDAHILSELPYSVRVIPPVRIDPQVSVGQGAIIGPHVYVERGSSIGYGAKIKNSIVLERSNVQADANLDGCIVTSKGVIKTT